MTQLDTLAETHAVVNLDAYQHNIALLRESAPSDSAFMAVVKADAYGHGLVECARAAVAAGSDWLGVARIAEAMRVRSAEVDAPVLVLGPPVSTDLVDAIRADITLAAGSESMIEAIGAAARTAGQPARVHLKIDIGMRRYGFLPADAVPAIWRLSAMPEITVEGVFSHFSSADEPGAEPTREQIAAFSDAIDEIRLAGFAPRWVHLANSAGILTGRTGPTNMVRAGAATYGLSPSPDVPCDERFRPVMSIRSSVTRVSHAPAGVAVSYNALYRTTAAEQLATVPVGYADGLPRPLANQGWFVIGGKRRPIRGRVCMDQTIVGDADGVSEGDEVIVVGPAALGAMTFEDVGPLSSTNNYEAATRLTARVPRIYVRDGRVVAFEHLLRDATPASRSSST